MSGYVEYMPAGRNAVEKPGIAKGYSYILTYVLVFAVHFFHSVSLFAQDPVSPEEIWDDLLQQEELNIEDDMNLLQAEYLRKHPLNLNGADKDALLAVPYLNSFLVEQLVWYRDVMGALLHVYELQAVPGWTPDLIRRVLPYITADEDWSDRMKREKWWRDGEHSILARFSVRLPERETASRLRSGWRMMLRYRYAFRDRLQYGVVADKDAGEPLFGPVQKAGFDFYSLHFFMRKKGVLHTLALGDFTVNMGQGLIHWQRLAFGKSGDIGQIKRQAAVLSPYQSAGEYNFHRGVATGWKPGKLNCYVFLSYRSLSATVARDGDGNAVSFSSFRTSGLHRTLNEQQGKNQVDQWAGGIVTRYEKKRWRISVNSVYHQFSLPMVRQAQPYNRFAINGRNWWNGSLDVGYTWRNIHLFGEWAIDQRGAMASLAACLVSLSPQFDLAVLRRDYSVKYRSVTGQAFGESSTAGNERGTFLSADWRPAARWRIRVFADQYFFPWIRSNKDAPFRGGDYQLQVTYLPRRGTEFSMRVRMSWNDPLVAGFDEVRCPKCDQASGIRFHGQIGMNGNMEMRFRAEWKQLRSLTRPRTDGFLYYTEAIWKPFRQRWVASLRAQYFETDGYAGRIYAYERDVLYFNSLPAFYDSGIRYYLLLRFTASKRVEFWLKWAQTLAQNRVREPHLTGESPENSISELKLQIRLLL